MLSLDLLPAESDLWRRSGLDLSISEMVPSSSLGVIDHRRGTGNVVDQIVRISTKRCALPSSVRPERSFIKMVGND